MSNETLFRDVSAWYDLLDEDCRTPNSTLEHLLRGPAQFLLVKNRQRSRPLQIPPPPKA